jgi:hypothetical protein
MSNMHYNNDLLNVLELNEICGNIDPLPFLEPTAASWNAEIPRAQA